MSHETCAKDLRKLSSTWASKLRGPEVSINPFEVHTGARCKCKNIMLVDDEVFNLKAMSIILMNLDPGIRLFKA
jgi:hypothetical protein